jgi:hypothetical protein
MTRKPKRERVGRKIIVPISMSFLKKYSILLLLILFAWVAKSQVIFPAAQPVYYKKYFEIKAEYVPSKQMQEENAGFARSGQFDIITGIWNDKLYPAKKSENEQKFILPGRAVVLFTAEDLEEIEPGLKTHPKLQDHIPAIANAEKKKLWLVRQSKLTCNETYNQNIQENKVAYSILNKGYSDLAAALFASKTNAPLLVLPALSSKLNNQAVYATDIFFEFGIDRIATQQTKNKNGSPRSNDDAVAYKLMIKDASGKVLKTYGQTVFVQCERLRKAGWGEQVLHALLTEATYRAGFTSLLHQFAEDKETGNKIKTTTTALRIKTIHDSVPIRLFKLKATAAHYHNAMRTSLSNLETTNDKIKSLGGSAIDFSGATPATTYNNPNISPSMNAAAESAVYGIASLVSLGINSANEKKIRELEQVAYSLKGNFEHARQMELLMVEEYNALAPKIKDAPTVHTNTAFTAQTNTQAIQGNTGSTALQPETFFSEGNTGHAAEASHTYAANTEKDFWDEGLPRAKDRQQETTASIAANTTASPATEESFWENAAATAQVNQPTAQKKPAAMRTSTELANNADELSRDINENASSGKQQLSNGTKNSLDWANQKISANQAVIEAATAGNSQGSNSAIPATGLPKSAGCPQAEAVCNQDLARIKAMGMDATSKDILNAQINCMRSTLQYCSSAMKPQEIAAIKQGIQSAENTLKELGGAPTWNLR